MRRVIIEDNGVVQEFLLDPKNLGNLQTDGLLGAEIALGKLGRKLEDEAYPNWRQLAYEISLKWGYLR